MDKHTYDELNKNKSEIMLNIAPVLYFLPNQGTLIGGEHRPRIHREIYLVK